MMKTMTTIILLAALGSLSLGWAQVDPDPDGIGIYFDTEATAVTATALESETVTGYLVLTNPTQTADLAFWESHISPFPSDAALVTGSPYGSYNYALNMPGSPSWSCLAMGFDPPLPAQPITLLAQVNVYIVSADSPVLLFVGEESNYGVEGSGGTIIFMNPSSGSADLPVASINGGDPVPADQDTWGEVKALFR